MSQAQSSPRPEAAAALRYRRFWLGLGWLLLVTILYLALKPMPNVAIVEIWSDKVWHGLVFGALMIWFAGVYPQSQFGRLFLLLLCYGVLIEILQSFTPNRHVEAADVLANVTGAVAGWLLARAGLARWCLWLENRVLRR